MANRDGISSSEFISMRDDLDFAHTLMCLAVERNLSGFSFAGIRVPRTLETWQSGAEVPKEPMIAAELATFQEQLYDRIVSLAGNKRMLREIWGFNERSRPFREAELSVPKSSNKAITEMADLLNALFVQDRAWVLSILNNCVQRRMKAADAQSGIVLPFPQCSPKS